MEDINVKEIKLLIDCCFLAAAAFVSEIESGNSQDFRTLYERPQDIAMQLIQRNERNDWCEQIRRNVPKAQIVEGIKKILLAEHKKEQLQKDFEK